MGLARIDLFDLAAARGQWLARRHALLSANVANADTPGFRPLDLREPGPGQLLAAARPAAGLVLARTDATHLGGAPPRPAAGERGRPGEGWEAAPAGNAVLLEEQAQKLAQTQLDHQLATGIYGKLVGLMRSALGVGA
jgi:flagellar basal-body rod protein FlgB